MKTALQNCTFKSLECSWDFCWFGTLKSAAKQKRRGGSILGCLDDLMLFVICLTQSLTLSERQTLIAQALLAQLSIARLYLQSA